MPGWLQQLGLKSGLSSSLSTKKPFQYGTRFQGRKIRLLRLKPGKRESTIRYELTEWPLDGNVQFKALSYTWGNPEVKRAILCNNRGLEVTENLHDALYHIRALQDESLFWIDAICINQQDMAEKTTQVQMMFDIYSKASEVTVWLGKEEDLEDAQTAFGYLNDAFLAIEESNTSDPNAPYAALESSGLFQPRWMQVYSIFRLHWFQRVWIIQEILAASECWMYCGRIRFRPDLVFAVAKSMRLGTA